MSGNFNPLTSKFGKGKNAPAPMATVAPSTNAPTFVTVEMLDAHLNQFGQQFMAILSDKLNTISAPAPVVTPALIASETAQPADPDDWQTWTPERLQVTGAGHEGKNNLVGIMTVIRDTLYPHWNDKGAVYPDDLKRLRLTAGNGGMNKAQKIETILSYRDAYVAHVEGSDPLPPVAPDNAPAPVAPVAPAPVSQDPGAILAWKKVAELQAQGWQPSQIQGLLLYHDLPNVLATVVTPAPDKAEKLATVAPAANRNKRKGNSDEWDYELAHNNTVALKSTLVPMYKALAAEYQAIDKKYGKRAKPHKQTARENFKNRVAEVTDAPTCGCKYGPSTTCVYAKQHNLYTIGANGRQYNLVYGDSSTYFAK